MERAELFGWLLLGMGKLEGGVIWEVKRWGTVIVIVKVIMMGVEPS